MEIASWLTDVHGPRLSGSPNIQKAGEWAVAKMKEWGLTSVALEPWDDQTQFPRGWSNDKFYLAEVVAAAVPDVRHVQAWTPGTKGLVRGEAMLVTSTDGRGVKKLVGHAARQVRADADAARRRRVFGSASAALHRPSSSTRWKSRPRRAAAALERRPRAARRPGGRRRRQPRRPTPAPALQPQRVLPEGRRGRHALDPNPRGHGLFTNGGNRSADPATTLPTITVAAEHYGRIVRQLAKGSRRDARSRHHATPSIPKPTMFNVVGEIRGTDKADEIVMLGAHFDSWHGSTGATDNAAGSAAMMEAMRILKASGVPLRRTVRIGLWNGEEQGLIGSRLYVQKHFAGRGAPPPAARRRGRRRRAGADAARRGRSS